MKKMDADAKMRMSNTIAMALMFVKIVMASFPFLVVPQECDKEACSMGDKLKFWNIAIIFNGLSFLSFCNLYYIQSRREYFLIDKFDEDDEVAEDELSNEIKGYPDIHKKILDLNNELKMSNKVCIVCFVLNTLGSSIAILASSYLDSTTLTVILTNSMLVNGKLEQIKKTYNCDDLAMSSVSLKQRVFNIIDRDISGKGKDIEMQSEDDNNKVVSEQDIATTIMQLGATE